MEDIFIHSGNKNIDIQASLWVECSDITNLSVGCVLRNIKHDGLFQAIVANSEKVEYLQLNYGSNLDIENYMGSPIITDKSGWEVLEF